MDTDICTTEPGRPLPELYQALPEGSAQRRQRLYPVIGPAGALVGVLPWSAVLAGRSRRDRQVRDVMLDPAAVAYPDEVLRSVADRMAALGLGTLPVVSRSDAGRLEGIITQFNLLQAREKLLVEERHAERLLALRRVGARRGSQRRGLDGDAPGTARVARSACG
jgi:chloride channel protein, CIC family